MKARPRCTESGLRLEKTGRLREGHGRHRVDLKDVHEVFEGQSEGPRDTPSVSSHRSMNDGLTILRPDCASCPFLLLRSGARHPYGPASIAHCGLCTRSAHAVYLGCLQHPHERKEMSQMMTNDEQSGDSLRTEEVATLGGGCFWCLEAVFDELRGVKEVVSGYSGGTVPDPTYEQVCTGTTGHAEVVRVTFDPSEISFREILEVYFSIHDPTTLNRQGADVGTQYRSAIFYHTPEQKRVGEEVIAELEEASVWERPIVTELTPASDFYIAEDYHQEYFQRNQGQPYCQVVVAPKVAKLRKQHLDKLKV